MRRKSYWSRTVGLLGGTATFDVYTPDDIEMTAKDKRDKLSTPIQLLAREICDVAGTIRTGQGCGNTDK